MEILLKLMKNSLGGEVESEEEKEKKNIVLNFKFKK